MDLKCLIKLLLEKNYIHNVSTETFEKKMVSGLYEFEHIEIYKKIKDSKYNKDVIFIERSRYQKNRFYIVNIKNLEEALISLGEGKENFGFRADNHGFAGIEPLKLVDIIEKKTRFNVLRLSTKEQVFMKLHDAYIKELRIKQEKEKEIEILDFLNKLP